MRALFIVFVMAGMLLPWAIAAQTHCAERDSVVSKMEAAYGETFAGGGMQSGAAIFEVWRSLEDGTWTILMTRADGMSCVMASGTHWREALPARHEAEGAPG